MKNRYGQLPKVVDYIEVINKEMLFYQDMPVKMIGDTECKMEKRLFAYYEILSNSVQNFIETYGMQEYKNRYVYISAKYLFQKKQEPFNRPGWHADGFMSDDVTYIWSDKNPTIFNFSEFTLTQHHLKSILEMNEQAKEENNMAYNENTLVRIDQYNIHKVADVTEDGMRAFVKISFSKDKYDLIGNSHNYELDYNWEMKERSIQRNIPQSKLK